MPPLAVPPKIDGDHIEGFGGVHAGVNAAKPVRRPAIRKITRDIVADRCAAQGLRRKAALPGNRWTKSVR
jgi:hypothetical protein